jgi:hypothetical protein
MSFKWILASGECSFGLRMTKLRFGYVCPVSVGQISTAFEYVLGHEFLAMLCRYTAKEKTNVFEGDFILFPKMSA